MRIIHDRELYALDGSILFFERMRYDVAISMDPSIFKAYDIRGLAGEQLDAASARRIGKSLAERYHPKQVLVGKDMRTSSDELENGLVEGLVSAGVSVTKIGLCSTPMFNFAVGSAAGIYDLGVMVTASHNPAEYNGFKIVQGDCLPVGQGSGMEELRDLACGERPLLDQEKRGSVQEDPTVLKRYLERILALAALPKKLSALRIAADAGNGMNSIVLPKLRAKLSGVEMLELFWDLDGSFPNHEANPLKTETLAQLRKKVIKNGCAFGVAFYGDGDRVGFVDETGTPIPGDLMTALLAGELMRTKGAGLILYDVRSSWSVPESVAEQGGTSEMCRVGHALIKRQMRERQALFAGELSMHFYFSDLWNCESGDLALLLLLKMLVREGKPLSQLWKPLHRYAHAEERNFTVNEPLAVIAKLDAHYANQPTLRSDLDGLRLEFRSSMEPELDWWFNVRPSNTEPLLRLNVEARSEEEMRRHQKELSSIIEETT